MSSPLFPLLDMCSTHVTLNHCNIEEDTRRLFDDNNRMKVLLIELLRLSLRSISSISFVDVEAVHTSVKGTYWCVQPESNKRTDVLQIMTSYTAALWAEVLTSGTLSV